MGQKSNPISLRSNLKNTQWFSKYIEKTNKDSSLIIYQDLVIREYINRFFSLHYLVPFLITGLVIVHMAAVHFDGSNNPLGIASTSDKISFFPYFFIKDTEKTKYLKFTT